MGQVIEIDFKNKVKLLNYVSYKWKCLICNAVFNFDSREKDRVPYIQIKKDFGLCKQCSLDVKHTCEELGWKRDK